jgi:hypothetical protein
MGGKALSDRTGSAAARFVTIRYMAYEDPLRQICGQLDRGEIDSRQFLELFTRGVAAEMGCSRTGVWVLVESDDGGRVLHNIALYDGVHDRMATATDMESNDVVAYFEALMRDGYVVAPDARTHHATVGFLEEYLLPLDIYSLMDVAVSANGNMFGAFSCEQVGRTMNWTPRQLQRLRQIGAIASLTLVRAVHWQVDTAHGDLWETSTPNRLLTMPMPLVPDKD